MVRIDLVRLESSVTPTQRWASPRGPGGRRAHRCQPQGDGRKRLVVHVDARGGLLRPCPHRRRRRRPPFGPRNEPAVSSAGGGTSRTMRPNRVRAVSSSDGGTPAPDCGLWWRRYGRCGHGEKGLGDTLPQSMPGSASIGGVRGRFPTPCQDLLARVTGLLHPLRKSSWLSSLLSDTLVVLRGCQGSGREEVIPPDCCNTISSLKTLGFR